MRKIEKERAIQQKLYELQLQLREAGEKAENYDLLWINIDTILMQALKLLAESYSPDTRFYVNLLISECTNTRIDYSMHHPPR
jgi:hypothetical protein